MVFLRDSTCLTKFESTKKYWKKIDNGLKKKLQKQDNQLLSHRSKESSLLDHERPVPWNMTLRSSKTGKVEQLIPVGNRLSGIYLKEVINIPSIHSKSKSCPDLAIFGSSKLPLEIEAIKQPGSRYLPRRPEEKCGEEVLIENYSPGTKPLWGN
jgi:hypothetical protein